MKFLELKVADGVIRMSKIVRGADHFGAAIDEQTAFMLMDRYFEQGGNTIDTARIYGIRAGETYSNSEPIVGRWLKARGNRAEVVLVTKGAHHVMGDYNNRRVSKECIDADIQTSLNELGVDYVDVYFMHRDDPGKPVGEIMDALHEHVQAGRIRALGASNWTVARIRQANDYALKNGKTPFAISQIQWGLARTTPELWGDPTLVCMNEQEYADYLEMGIPVMGYASQGGGYFSKILAGQPLSEKISKRYDHPMNRERVERVRALCEKTGRSAAAICLAYITSNALSGAAIIGSANLEQLEDSMSAADLTLEAQDILALEQ